MERQSMLGAGSVLARGARIPKGIERASQVSNRFTGELWVGNPAKFKRYLTEEEIEKMRADAKAYWYVIYTIARPLI